MYGNARESIAAAISLFASLGKADLEERHVQLVTPAPFIWAEYGPTNPLAADGSDYPCKIPHSEAFIINGTATEMTIGEEQTVSFSGWSVHGGGSCQFAREYSTAAFISRSTGILSPRLILTGESK